MTAHHRNSSLVRLSLLCLIVAFVAGCDKPSGPATPSDVVKTYFSALVKGDQQTLREINVDGEGVSPIAVGAARSLESQRGKLTCTHTIKGDVAVATGTFANGEVINAVLKNVDGKWKIDRMANEKLISRESLIPDEFKEKKEESKKEEE